ncbi:MAG: photosynthetic complex assembly protein PuhC [Myxococcota bacterium]
MGHHHEQHVPRWVIAAAALMMIATIGLAALGRARATSSSDAAPSGEPYAELHVEDRENGEVAFFNAAGDEVWVVPQESGGFVRGVLRGVFRTRRLESVGPEQPLRLFERTDGELVLRDPATGHTVELRSFGQTNYESFAAILAATEARP